MLFGGFFCNFSTVKRFCRFCNCTCEELAAHKKLRELSLRPVTTYDSNIKSIEQNSLIFIIELFSVYGLKKKSYLNELSHCHVAC